MYFIKMVLIPRIELGSDCYHVLVEKNFGRSVRAHKKSELKVTVYVLSGATGRNRTAGLFITNELLYP